MDGQLHYTPDVTQEHRYIHDVRGSEVDVPILIGEKVQGVLIAENRKRSTHSIKTILKSLPRLPN